MSGVAPISVAPSMLTKLSAPPRAAQVRKDQRKTIVPSVKIA